MRALSLLSSVVLWVCCSVSQAQALKGASALQGDTLPQTEGYLKITPVAGDPLTEKFDMWMTMPHETAAIKSYQVEMTKKIHVVVVSDDFKSFMHIHPTLTPMGHFLITQKFPAPGVYQVYADGLPNKMNHQVFRFEITVGQGASKQTRALPANGMGVHVGPYEVDLSTVRMHAGRMEMVDVEILEHGQPAKDLHPYLGAPAHAVFLNSKDLSYVHVHPMGMNDSMDMSKPMPDLPENASVNGEMMLMVSIKEAGTYKLWLQFRGANDQLYVAEFTVLASA